MLATALILLALAQPGIAQEQLDRLKKIDDLMQKEQYTLAIELLDQMLESNPEDSELILRRESALDLQQKIETAQRLAQLLAEAKAYVQAHRAEAAQRRLQQILKFDPDHEEALALTRRLDVESEMEMLNQEQGGKLREGDFVDLEQVDQPPKIVRKASASYPQTARRLGIEGRTRFLATVGIDGKVEEVQVIQRIPGWDELNRSAEAAVAKYRFTPAIKDGVKVRTILLLVVDFRL